MRRYSSQKKPTWTQTLRKLSEEINEHGAPRDKKLKKFLEENRKTYQRHQRGEESSLSKQQVESLQQLGIALETPTKSKWTHNFQKLKAFVEKYGNFPYDVPHGELDEDGIALIGWCQKQKAICREHHRRNETSSGARTAERQERIDALNRIGFCWNAKERNWKIRFRELVEYARTHGDCLVPTTYHNQSLAVWVGEQRYHYNKYIRGLPSSMTKERIQLLRELDFVWNALDERWMRRYEEFKEYARLSGPGILPSMKHSRQLRRWCDRQRNERQKMDVGESSTMTADRIAKLDQLGFPW